jgi:hypothetical protein
MGTERPRSQNERLQRLRQLTEQRAAPDRAKTSAQRSDSSRVKVERQAVSEPQRRQAEQPARPNQVAERPMEQRKQEAISARERLMNQREEQQAARNDSVTDRYAPPSVRANEQSRVQQRISAPERPAVERQAVLPQQRMERISRPQNEARVFQRSEMERARPEVKATPQPERNVVRSQPQERSVSIDRQDSRRDDSRWSDQSRGGSRSDTQRSQPTRSHDGGSRGRR